MIVLTAIVIVHIYTTLTHVRYTNAASNQAHILKSASSGGFASERARETESARATEREREAGRERAIKNMH
jgi:hypothetical protein